METCETHLIAVKVHKTESGAVVGACDASLLGKKFKEGSLKLEVTKEFYFERHTTAEELADLLEDCMAANLVGEKSVGAYCEKNPDAKASVMKIKGVPHLQVFKL